MIKKNFMTQYQRLGNQKELNLEQPEGKPSSIWLDEGDCIMIGGKTLTFSYQAKNFCSNDSHNITLHIKDKKKASEMRYLFLIAALRGALYQKYSWGDSISMKKIQDDVFRLPIDTSGDPDWAYMDEYMQNMINDAKNMLERLG